MTTADKMIIEANICFNTHMCTYTHMHTHYFAWHRKELVFFILKKKYRISQEKTGKSLLEEEQKQLWTKGLHYLSQGQLLTFDILLNHEVSLIFPAGNRALCRFNIYRASGDDGRRETGHEWLCQDVWGPEQMVSGLSMQCNKVQVDRLSLQPLWLHTIPTAFS